MLVNIWLQLCGHLEFRILSTLLKLPWHFQTNHGENHPTGTSPTSPPQSEEVGGVLGGCPCHSYQKSPLGVTPASCYEDLREESWQKPNETNWAVISEEVLKADSPPHLITTYWVLQFILEPHIFWDYQQFLLSLAILFYLFKSHFFALSD